MKNAIRFAVRAGLGILALALLTCALPRFDSDPGDALAAGIAAKGAKAPAVNDPGQVGPYAVGHASFVLHDPDRQVDVLGNLADRPIPVDVFYPVDSDMITASTPEAVFPLDPINGLAALTYSSEWEAFGHDRVYEAPPPSAKKPFPLLVLSEGWGCATYFHNFFAGRLASHGFVVAVVYHYGDWMFVWEPFDHIATAMLNRLKDIPFVLDALLDRNTTAGDPLGGVFDPERIAASGFSLGGFACTALACGTGSIAEIWTFPGWIDFMGSPPADTLVPCAPDPRIKAIIPLDGSSWALRFADLARVSVPALGLGQEWSTLALDPDPAWASQQARQHAAFQGHPNYRVDIRDTIHQSFANVYAAVVLLYRKAAITEAEYEWLIENYCSSELSSSESNRLMAKYAVAFLKTVLAGESGYRNILTPGYALTREQYVEFFVTEKRSPSSIEEDWPFAWPSFKIYFQHQPGSAQAKAARKP